MAHCCSVLWFPQLANFHRIMQMHALALFSTEEDKKKNYNSVIRRIILSRFEPSFDPSCNWGHLRVGRWNVTGSTHWDAATFKSKCSDEKTNASLLLQSSTQKYLVCFYIGLRAHKYEMLTDVLSQWRSCFFVRCLTCGVRFRGEFSPFFSMRQDLSIMLCTSLQARTATTVV